MRARTSVLVAAAVGAVALGVAVPFIATAASPTPALADAPGSGQSVVDWNRQLLAILGTPGAQPATVHPTRSLAMLQAAEYDAVVSVTHAGPAYRTAVTAPAGARPDAAADQAAHDVLVSLYPARAAALDALLATQLAAMPAGASQQDGITVGKEVADRMITLRASDGSASDGGSVTAGTDPGRYRPTPPKFTPPMFPRWGSVTPFVLDDGHRFRPAAPPAVTSGPYATALAEVRSLGQDTSTTRTADETVAGRFWSATPIWTTWNQVAQQVAGARKASLADTTRAFAALDLSLADTTIALYDAKYTDLVWRPVTAVRVGEPGVPTDPAWNPLTPTAADPSYPGAHSALSAAAASALAAAWGDVQDVTVTSAADPGVSRHFGTLSAVAEEAGLSRIWAGQHTRIDHATGQQLGHQVAGAVVGAVGLRPTA